MKILFICENYFPYVGGAEVVFKNLAERYVQQGHAVTVLTHRMPETLKTEIINGVSVVRVNSFDSRYWFTFSSIIKAVSLARKHDIIQTTSFNGAPSAWVAAKLTRKPVVITVHEVWAGKWKEVTGFSWLKSAVHELLERAIYLLPYDRYVCVSKATKNDLEKMNVNKKKIVMIYNGFDYEFWNPQNIPGNLKQKLNLEHNFIFFSWGRAGASKGFEYLIEAIPKICRINQDIRFLLMFSKCKTGSSRRTLLRSLVTKLNLGEKVIILEQVSNSENRNYIKSADGVIIPSTAEGFGYAALEAIAMGTPVLVSSAGSLPEIISGKHLVFESKNVNDLIEKAINMVNHKFNNTPLKKFSWEDCVNHYLQTYEKLTFH